MCAGSAIQRQGDDGLHTWRGPQPSGAQHCPSASGETAGRPGCEAEVHPGQVRPGPRHQEEKGELTWGRGNRVVEMRRMKRLSEHQTTLSDTTLVIHT